MYTLPMTKILVCQSCGEKFEIYRNPSGGFSRKKYCFECEEAVRNRRKFQTCQKCGKIFTPPQNANGGYNLRKYCDGCQPKTSPTFVCQFCGKVVQKEKTKQGYYGNSKKYCSDECMQKATCSRIGKLLTCEKCGKQFEMPINSAGWRYKTKWCPDCIKASAKPEKGWEKTCPVCGKIFYGEHRLRGTKYCSEECRKVGQAKAMEATLVEKYGVHNLTEVPGKQEKFVRTMQEKYGVSYACQLKSCIDGNKNTISQINLRFATLLEKFGISYVMEHNINGCSYDFFLPNLPLAIEINPNYTHTVSGNHYNGFAYNEKYLTWHINRTENARNYGNCFCLHIWQWDDWDKILGYLTFSKFVSANKTKIRMLNQDQTQEFLDNNSIYDGFILPENSLNYGLFSLTDDELLCLVSFVEKTENTWELLSFCFKQFYRIQGGLQKLFFNFVQEKQPNTVITFCDYSKTPGTEFEVLGFKFKEQSLPRENLGAKEQENREHYMSEEKDKHSDMLSIYDCGTKTFIWLKEDN